MFQFRHIEYLIALAGVPLLLLLFFLLLRWKKNAIRKIGDAALVKQLLVNFSRPLFTFKFLLILIAFTLGCVALADPVTPDRNQMIQRKGIDVMIAIDVSNSMLAEDVKPNRLERARQTVSRIIDRLADDRIGIVIFAGRAYVQMPMTSDHSAAKMYLTSISTDDVPTQGTAIGAALKMCFSSFNTKDKKYRSIVLITDGEDHDEDAIQTAAKLADQGVMINTIGIGSPQGSPIKDKETNELKKDEAGNIVISRLNEGVLKEIAAKGQGIYQHFTSADEVASNIHKQLGVIEQTTLTDSSSMTYINYFWYFVAAAFFLLLLEFFIPETKKKMSLTMVLLMFISLPASAQKKKEIIKANEEYKKGNFENASSSYQKVLEKDQENIIAAHNQGNTLYRLSRPDDAIQYYDKTIGSASDKSLKARAFYNKGVAYQSQKKLPECIEAYKEALKLTPDDEQARQNLQRALQQQKQQQQKQDQKDQKKNKDEKKEEKKKPEEQDPKPQPSRLTKQDAEEKLKSLLDHEKDLHEKLRKVKASMPDKPKKDW